MTNITLSVGSTIRSRENDNEYIVRSIGPMVAYSGDEGEGEVAIQSFDSEFTVVQPEVTIHAYIRRIDCPYCDEPLGGFLGDPRGTNVDCEQCGRSFNVPVDAAIML